MEQPEIDCLRLGQLSLIVKLFRLVFELRDVVVLRLHCFDNQTFIIDMNVFAVFLTYHSRSKRDANRSTVHSFNSEIVTSRVLSPRVTLTVGALGIRVTSIIWVIAIA